MCCVESLPSPQAIWLPWKLCCRIAGWPLILSIGWNSGKKNPVKPRPVAVENGPRARLPSRSRGFRLRLVPGQGYELLSALLSAVVDANKNCQ